MLKRTYAVVVLMSAVVVLAIIATVSLAEDAGHSTPAAQPEMKLPPGWTQADMQACAAAGTPGKMHELLARDFGVWQCQTMMWPGPGAEPLSSGGTCTITGMYDGRYSKCEIEGEMPGMGRYHSTGFYGFDNVTQAFVSTFIDNMSTGIMTGTGELSDDGKTLTWSFTYNCPITKKPSIIREIQTVTGDNTRRLEMFGSDPKSGKEFKMMRIEMSRK